MTRKSFYGWLAGALVLAAVLAFVVLREGRPGSGADAYTEQLSCYGPPLGLHLPQALPDLLASYGGESDEIRFESYRGKLTKITYTCYTG